MFAKVNREERNDTTSKLKIFILTWLGQLISLIGSGLTKFALDFWIYQKTGSVTQYTLIALFSTLPGLFVSPIAGALVDRWDRRLTMILSNAGSALATLLITLLLLTEQIQIWHIYTAVSIISVCNALQMPAYAAVTTLLVPEKHLGRASGMVQIGEASSRLFAPALAGILVLLIQIQGVLIIDFLTYLFAFAILSIVKFPKTETTTAGQRGKSSLFREVTYGWTYITAHPGLLGLLLYFAASNFLIGIASVLIIPMLLTFVSSATAGTILSIGGISTLVGSLVISVWGGPKRRIYGIFGFGLLLGVCIFFSGLRPSIPLVTAAIFGSFFCIPFIAGCSEAILQSQVALDVQGRVFAVQGMIAGSSLPLAYLVAGPLADHVFKPLLTSDGPLAGSLGRIIGVGSGRGMGLLFIVLGILLVILTVGAYLYYPLRLLDQSSPNKSV